jgi:hypothetical protein
VKALGPRTVASLTAAVTATAICAVTALAASSPKPGYHYENVDVGNGSTVNVISMSVAEDATLTATGADPKCQDEGGLYKGFSITKPIDASNGKFKYDGKATSTLPDGPSKVKIDLKGKFSSPKQAKGSYTLEGCDGKVKFKTQFSLGG